MKSASGGDPVLICHGTDTMVACLNWLMDGKCEIWMSLHNAGGVRLVGVGGQ